jgi:nucleotide-binding universal stress UspA family protein
MKTVLACIDDSAATRPVLAMARAVAPLFDAEVEAVHVDEVGETAREAARAFDVKVRTLHGDVVAALTEAAGDEEVVIVVVGARGRPKGARPAGHVALELADRVDAPVLVVPPEAKLSGHVERVLVAMQGTPASARSLKRTIALAAGADLDLVVLHVDDERSIPSFSDQVQHETESYAREFLARYAPGLPEGRLELRVGLPGEEILRASDAIDPDILVLGRRQHEKPGPSPVVREVLEHSHRPVLLVALA